MNSNDLFTAPQVAKICSTDLKTIHNWVKREEIKYFRTPGRHLRFKRQDVIEFLTKFGYPIPDGFVVLREHVVVLDENEAFNNGLQQMLSKDMNVDGYTNNLDAMFAIGKKQPSLVLINGDSLENVRVVDRLLNSEEPVPVVVYGIVDQECSYLNNAGIAGCLGEADPTSIHRKVVDLLDIKT